MNPALAAGLVRSPLNEFSDLYPIDLFAGGLNADENERREKRGEVREMDRQYELTALMRISSSQAVHLRSRRSREQ